MEKQPKATVQLSTGTRVYYFDVHNDKTGKDYICITEILTEKAVKGKKRSHIFVHSSNIDDFISGLKEARARMKTEQEML